MFFLVSFTAFALMVGMFFPPFLLLAAGGVYLIYRLGRKRLEEDNAKRARARVRYFSS